MNQTPQAPQTSRRATRRALGTVVTALVIVAVVLLNLLFSLVADRFMWQVDETATRYINDGGMSMYTIDDLFVKLVEDSIVPAVESVNADRAARGEEPIRINIIFCAERDFVYASERHRLLQYTAMNLRREFPDIFDISYINVNQNPSAVQKYKATSSTRIYSSQLIIEFGTEFRVCSPELFFLKSDESSTDYWAYNGEQKMASLLLAVTRAESPVACFTTNHGEALDRIASFRTLVERAGYVVRNIDLERDELPKNCRLLITYDPQTDFYGFGNPSATGVSEIDRLDKFLDDCYSFLLFVDSDTPELPLLEEYLEEWGVGISRGENAEGDKDNYLLRDPQNRLDDEGYTLIGSYATAGTGASITSDMRNVTYPAKVVFSGATAIHMADGYKTTFATQTEDDGTELDFRYGTYYKNGVTRYFFDVFTTGKDASAEAFGETYEIATEQNLFKLMTLTSEQRSVQETQYLSTRDPSYVCVVGSTDFVSDAVLDSTAYGNTDVMLATLRVIGREVVPAKMNYFKAFKEYEVDTSAYELKTSTRVATMVWMTLIPAAVCTTAGIIVNVKRKFR